MLTLKTFIQTKIFFLIFLTLIVFLLYGKSINYDFVGYDERIILQQNADKLSQIKNIPLFFTTSCFFLKTSNYYRPLLTLSFSIESVFFNSNKRVYHLNNIILFIVAIYLMYLFLEKLKLNDKILKCCCLIVAVHPVFASTVVWIPSRNDTLLAIFIFLSFIFLINYLKYNSFKYLFFYALFFAAALFTKETAIFSVFLYMIFPYSFDYKIENEDKIKIFLPIGVIFVFYFLMRSISVQEQSILEYCKNIDYCLKNFICGTTTHLIKFFYPKNIPIFLHNLSVSWYYIFFDIFVLGGLFVLYFKKIVNVKVILFSSLWFILQLIPTFLLLDYVYFNHRLFVSVAGIIIIITTTINYIINRYNFLKNFFVVVFIFILISFCIISYSVEEKYQDKNKYLKLAKQDAPTWHIVSNENALFYLEKGDYEKYKENMFQAYKSTNDEHYIFYILAILVNEGQTDNVKEICFNMLKDEKLKDFYKIGANTILGNICLRENKMEEAYKYLKTAVKLGKTNKSFVDKVKALEEKIANSKDSKSDLNL